jgi:hypothetical protein
MSTATTTPKKTYELIAIIFLLPALYIQIKWLQVFNDSSSLSPSARTSTFLESFPSAIASSKLIALLSLLFSVAAVVYASRSFNQTKIVWRISSFIVVLVGSLIALLSIFQLM